MGWTGGYVPLAMLLAPLPAQVRQIHVPPLASSSATASTRRRPRRWRWCACLTASLTYIIGQMTGVGVPSRASSAFPATPASTSAIGLTVFGGTKGHHSYRCAVHRADRPAHRCRNASSRCSSSATRCRSSASVDHGRYRCLAARQARPHREGIWGFDQYLTSIPAARSTCSSTTPVADDGCHPAPFAARHHALLHRSDGGDARSSAGWALIFIALQTPPHLRSARWPAEPVSGTAELFGGRSLPTPQASWR